MSPTVNQAAAAAAGNVGPGQSGSNDSGLRSERKQIACLNGARFFPFLAILFDHVSAAFPFVSQATGGMIFPCAVGFFFMLSGFVLTLGHWDLAAKASSVGRFYLARFARLWPSHAFSLGLLILLVPEVFKVTKTLMPTFLLNAGLVHACFPFWRIYYSFNAPSWCSSSLLVLYLVFPFLLWGLRKSWFGIFSFAAATSAALVWACNAYSLPITDPDKICQQGLLYISPLARMLEFVVGMLCAMAFRNFFSRVKLRSAVATLLEIGFIASVVAMALVAPHLRATMLPPNDAFGFWLQCSGLTLLPFAGVILALATESGAIAKFLSTRIIQRLGDITFSIYMLQSVFLAYMAVKLPGVQSPEALLGYLVVLFISSVGMLYLFEEPMRVLIMKLAGRRQS